MRKQTATNFFFHNAGFAYDPKTETKLQGRWRCARELAAAEARANVEGITFRWAYDAEPCNGCDCGSDDCACATGAEHETLGCIAETEQHKHLASLWGICGATNAYRRVVEAELAAEALIELDKVKDSNLSEAQIC